jgi:predicted MFS family arabinose efflux permease
VILKLRLGVHTSTSNLLAMLFDLGQMLGGVAGGLLIDRLGSSMSVSVVMLLLSALPLYFLGAPAGLPLLAILLLLAGRREAPRFPVVCGGY